MSFQCPSCDKTLASNAKACSCGWTSDPKKAKEEPALLRSALDHQCSYNDHGDRCRYPVSMFEPGQQKAFCRYHKRNIGDVDLCQKIVARSWRDTDEDYQRRSDAETYGGGDAKRRSALETIILENLHVNSAATRKAEREALLAPHYQELVP